MVFCKLGGGWRGLCGLLLVLVSLPVQAAWGMNDATVIYPLPQSQEGVEQMLAPQDSGKGGPLLPQRFWQRLPAINQGESLTRTYRNLRVVAVRFDPCFKVEGECRAQVRLVWQPIDQAGYGSTSPQGLETKDAAVHSFHTLGAAAFRQMIAEYDMLSRGPAETYGDAPLQVHPVMRQQGLEGRFALGLRRLLLKYCGEANLWRVTSMSSW